MSELDHIYEKVDDLEAENAELRHEIKRLRTALKECLDDLENEIEHRYRDTLDYPSQKLKFDRDMEPVLAARKLLAVIDEQSEAELPVGEGNMTQEKIRHALKHHLYQNDPSLQNNEQDEAK